MLKRRAGDGAPFSLCYQDAMQTRDNTGTVEIDGDIYHWELRRQPRPLSGGKWEGIAVTLRLADFKREAIVQFPPPLRPNGRPDTEKQFVNPDHIRNAVIAVMEAGWNPTSRGKPMVFDVDIDGH